MFHRRLREFGDVESIRFGVEVGIGTITEPYPILVTFDVEVRPGQTDPIQADTYVGMNAGMLPPNIASGDAQLVPRREDVFVKKPSFRSFVSGVPDHA